MISIFTNQSILLQFCFCLCLCHWRCLLCSKCNVEFEIICRQPCPHNCLECSSQDSCLTCIYTKLNSADIGSYVCSSSCEEQCILNRTCLGGCSVLRDIPPYRPVLCVTKETCFKCLQLHGGCLKCSDGMYGSQCDKRCGYCQRDDKGLVKCNTYTGECKDTCEDGFFGRRCDRECNNCLSIAGGSNRCEILSGRCVYGCISGWFHDTCNETCSNTCLNRSCNQVSGYCDFGCVAGWYGDKCEKSCSDKCAKASCDQITGACSNGCITGWYGFTCDNFCTYTCQEMSCNQVTGNCSNGCVYGWYGASCEKRCSHTCFNRSCDQMSGYCDFGCAYGFQGDMCNERCKEFFNVSMTDKSSEDGLEDMDKTHFALSSNIDPVVYAAGGCLVGVVASLSCTVIICYIRKTIRCRRYNNMGTSSTEISTPIYDEIAQSSGSTLRSISNTYTDIGSEPTVENIEDSSTSSSSSRFYEFPDIGTSNKMEAKTLASLQPNNLKMNSKSSIIHSKIHTIPVSFRINRDGPYGLDVAHSLPETSTKQQYTDHSGYKCDRSVNTYKNKPVKGSRDSCISYSDSYEQVQLQMGRNMGEDGESVNYLHPIV